MKTLIIAIMALGLGAGAAAAQGMTKPMSNEKSPGTTGAMKMPTAPSVATSPQQVQEQQGDSAKQSAGTVGAAPGAATDSQTSTDKK